MDHPHPDPLLAYRLARNELAAALGREVIDTLGRTRALPILARAVVRLRSAEARRLARQWGENSLTALGTHFRRLQAEQGILEVAESGERRLAVCISRCPSTEAFRLLGAPELAPLFCASEPAFIKAFNPQLRHRSRQTIARGGACCDHVWSLGPDQPEGRPVLAGAPCDGETGETVSEMAMDEMDMERKIDMDSRLQERITRYELAVAFAKALVDEVGEGEALPIIQRAFDKLQVSNGQKLAQSLGSNSLRALAEDMSKTARELDGFEVLEVTDRHVATKITRCVAWEAFNALGMPQLCAPYCESDHAYIKAYNPGLRLIRTKTIAAGDAYCDHIWALEDDADQ